MVSKISVAVTGANDGNRKFCVSIYLTEKLHWAKMKTLVVFVAMERRSKSLSDEYK